MRFHRGVVLAIALGAAAGAGGALAQSAGYKAAATRHDNFKQLGGASKAIKDELGKDAPDKAVIAAAAARMAMLAPQVPSWFPKGSGPESGFKTHARAEVWSDAAGFATAAKNLQVETDKLQQVTAGGDIAAIKMQYKATGGACKSCHDKYRLPED